MSFDKGRERKIERAQDDTFSDQLAEYHDEKRFRELKAGAEKKYGELISCTPEKYRPWVLRVAAAVEENKQNPPSRPLRFSKYNIVALFHPDYLEKQWRRRQWRLENFLNSLAARPGSTQVDVLKAVVLFLDAQDYEKRPWEDDSGSLMEALEYCDLQLADLIQAALAEGDDYTRQMAAKWLPKYALDDVSAPVLRGLLADRLPRVRWWAAIHLSRIAPDTPALVPVLVEALKEDWMPSARVLWCFGLQGAGEAAEALGHLGSRARKAIPDLVEVVRLGGKDGLAYNQQLAARALFRIAGAEETIRLLTPFRELDGRLGTLLDDSEAFLNGWPKHACFVARFVWREGEDDYWMYAAPDDRGAV